MEPKRVMRYTPIVFVVEINSNRIADKPRRSPLSRPPRVRTSPDEDTYTTHFLRIAKGNKNKERLARFTFGFVFSHCVFCLIWYEFTTPLF